MSHLSYPSTNYSFNNEITTGSTISVSGVTPSNKLISLLTADSDNKWVQFYVPEVIDIPSQKPDVEDIVSVNSCIQIISQHVVKTPIVTGYVTSTGTTIPGSAITNAEGTKLTGRKLIITGILKQKVIYTALVPEQSLHSASYCVPFSVYIIIDANTPLSQSFRVTPYIEDIWAIRLSERSLFKNTTIFINAAPIN